MNEKSADIYNSFKGGYDGFNFYDMANFNWHFAYNKKFPFIKIGFKNIEKLYKEL